MAYKGALMLRDDEIINVFDACKKLGCLPMVHAENGDIIAYQEKKLIQYGITGPEGHLQSRPEIVEAEATGRAIMLGKSENCRILSNYSLIIFFLKLQPIK